MEADQFLTDAGVDIRQVEGDRAYYRLSADEIVLPKWEQFSSANHSYQTALHELGHATGHSERMNRRSLIEGLKAGFGSEAYAREELRAEISTMMPGETSGSVTAPAGSPMPRVGSRSWKRISRKSAGLRPISRRSPTASSFGAGSGRDGESNKPPRALPLGPHRMQPPCYREPDRRNPGRSMEPISRGSVSRIWISLKPTLLSPF